MERKKSKIITCKFVKQTKDALIFEFPIEKLKLKIEVVE
jgi:hypothetical protein